MKKIVGIITFGLILLAIAYWFVSSTISDRRVEEEKQELETEKRLQVEKSITDIITKHNAVTEWKHGFDKKGLASFGEIYTIEVEEVLIRADDRPIMFFANVEDVVKEANRYLVYFHNRFDFLLRADIHFVLDCTQDQVNEIILSPRAPFESNYAVIAKVSSIEKCIVRVRTEDNGRVGLSSPIFTSNVFVATGRCLDLLFVGDYKPAIFPEDEPK